jgi:lyso-ornithine lipid O-acyltransferase
MRRFRQGYRSVLVLMMFAAGLITVAIVFPACSTVLGRTASRIKGRIQQAWYRCLLAVLNVDVRTTGVIAEEATLWVSNHISWLDIVVLGARRPLSFIAKSEVGTWPVVGFMARRNGTLLVRRGDGASSREVAEAMAWRLRQRQRLVLFPEGTSSKGENVLRFHARLFQPATLVGAKVQAIGIAYRGAASTLVPFVGDDDFLPHLWRLLAESSITVDLAFCRPLSAGGLGRDRLAQLTHHQITDALTTDTDLASRTALPSG